MGRGTVVEISGCVGMLVVLAILVVDIVCHWNVTPVVAADLLYVTVVALAHFSAVAAVAFAILAAIIVVFAAAVVVAAAAVAV